MGERCRAADYNFARLCVMRGDLAKAIMAAPPRRRRAQRTASHDRARERADASADRPNGGARQPRDGAAALDRRAPAAVGMCRGSVGPPRSCQREEADPIAAPRSAPTPAPATVRPATVPHCPHSPSPGAVPRDAPDWRPRLRRALTFHDTKGVIPGHSPSMTCLRNMLVIEGFATSVDEVVTIHPAFSEALETARERARALIVESDG